MHLGSFKVWALGFPFRMYFLVLGVDNQESRLPLLWLWVSTGGRKLRYVTIWEWGLRKKRGQRLQSPTGLTMRLGNWVWR